MCFGVETVSWIGQVPHFNSIAVQFIHFPVELSAKRTRHIGENAHNGFRIAVGRKYNRRTTVQVFEQLATTVLPTQLAEINKAIFGNGIQITSKNMSRRGVHMQYRCLSGDLDFIEFR